MSAENVFVSERSVEDAAETVIEPPTLKLEPLMVPREPVSLLVPMEVVATTCPVASVERSALVRLGSQTVPKVLRDEEAFWRFTTRVKVVEAVKRLLPLQVFVSERSVEEADEPLPTHVPFIERQPLNILMPLPKVEVAFTPPPTLRTLAMVVEPVLETLSTVVEAEFETRNELVSANVSAPQIVNVEYGEVVPTPTFPPIKIAE